MLWTISAAYCLEGQSFENWTDSLTMMCEKGFANAFLHVMYCDKCMLDTPGCLAHVAFENHWGSHSFT